MASRLIFNLVIQSTYRIMRDVFENYLSCKKIQLHIKSSNTCCYEHARYGSTATTYYAFKDIQINENKIFYTINLRLVRRDCVWID